MKRFIISIDMIRELSTLRHFFEVMPFWRAFCIRRGSRCSRQQRYERGKGSRPNRFQGHPESRFK